MSKTIKTFAINGNGTKSKNEELINYINSLTSRISVEKLVKQFMKVNEEKNTVKVSTIPSFKEVQTCCFIVASSKKDGEKIPCYTVNSDGVVVVEYKAKTPDIFDLYYGKNKSHNKSYDPLKMIVNMMLKNDIDIETVKKAYNIALNDIE